MSEYSAHAWVFTVASCALWVATLRWALKQREKRYFYLVVLGLATAFWFVGETLGIRLGKYDYAPFPLPLRLPGGGSPGHPDLAARLLWSLPGAEPGPPGAGAECLQRSWDVPFPVVALEAVLLFAFLRFSVLRLNGRGLRVALATAGLSALLMINVTAVLDPVVSTSAWCDVSMSNPNHPGLNVGLWHWITNGQHPGYWFGVPLVNYIAWFLSVGTFSFVLRLDDDGPRGFITRRYAHWYQYVGLFFILLIVFAILIPLKIVVDQVMVHGQEYLFIVHPTIFPKAWQFGVLLLVLVVGLRLVMRFGRTRHNPEFEWVSAVPQLVVFALCLVALLIQWHAAVFATWCVMAAVAVAVIWGPFIVRSFNRAFPPAPLREIDVHVR